MTPPHLPAQPTSTRPTPLRRLRGSWYFVVTVVSVGLVAALPFWHAANRLGRRKVRTLGLAYTAADILLFVIIYSTPRRPDGSSDNETLTGIGAIGVLAVAVLACVQLRSLRREVYGGNGIVPAHSDPAVARALAARARREETRELIARDPALRRELGIGRPDLGRGLDDGGLIDVNTAPADVIGRVRDIERVHADAIVAGRTARGGSWFNVGELLIDVPLPPYVQEQLRERAVV